MCDCGNFVTTQSYPWTGFGSQRGGFMLQVLPYWMCMQPVFVNNYTIQYSLGNMHVFGWWFQREDMNEQLNVQSLEIPDLGYLSYGISTFMEGDADTRSNWWNSSSCHYKKQPGPNNSGLYIHEWIRNWMRIGYITWTYHQISWCSSKKDILKVEFEWIQYMFRGFGSSPGFYAGIKITQNGKWSNLAIAKVRTM